MPDAARPWLSPRSLGIWELPSAARPELNGWICFRISRFWFRAFALADVAGAGYLPRAVVEKLHGADCDGAPSRHDIEPLGRIEGSHVAQVAAS